MPFDPTSDTTPELPLPIKHLNGGNWERLSEQYHAAYRAARELQNAMAEIEFHARDYYVHRDPNAFEQARLARDTHRADLHHLTEYLRTHYEHMFLALNEF